ncbi:beta-1,3-galactosyltransferase 6 [Cylas formicarius]|uniref:beta-1,3-galactosyltransferase 6 n=1 Tax=Cylas formicarius TaxID=197179 RepID=UPI0029584D5A|nr:beta-1,3-galactosyltransferase 6 [Cylas formicarius]
MQKLNNFKKFRILFVAVLSFLLGSMLTINLTPIERTCRVKDTDREHNIMKNSKLKSPELIILILSAPKNLNKRNSIRSTWITLGSQFGKINPIGYTFKHYFVIGNFNTNDDISSELYNEQNKFSDILLLPVYDNYKNLTLKVLKSFQWLSEQHDYGLDFKYALKCDDDSFINLNSVLIEIHKMENMLFNSNLYFPLNLSPEKLNHFITTSVQSNGDLPVENLSIFWGYFNGNAKIQTRGKWKEPDWKICDRYVPYALGGGYIMSKKLVLFIGRNAADLRMFKSEDISVGLWLSSVNNIIRIHDIRFDTEWISRGCKNYHLISHGVSTVEMRVRYENLLANKQLCTEESIKRDFYLYNWSLPPSQCCQAS